MWKRITTNDQAQSISEGDYILKYHNNNNSRIPESFIDDQPDSSVYIVNQKLDNALIVSYNRSLTEYSGIALLEVTYPELISENWYVKA